MMRGVQACEGHARDEAAPPWTLRATRFPKAQGQVGAQEVGDRGVNEEQCLAIESNALPFKRTSRVRLAPAGLPGEHEEVERLPRGQDAPTAPFRGTARGAPRGIQRGDLLGGHETSWAAHLRPPPRCAGSLMSCSH